MSEPQPRWNPGWEPARRRASCAVSPLGCLLWLGIFALAVWLVSWVAAMWGAR